jgi:hypothetical protein
MQLLPITGDDLVPLAIFDTHETFADLGIVTEVVPVNAWFPRNEGHDVLLTCAVAEKHANVKTIANI